MRTGNTRQAATGCIIDRQGKCGSSIYFPITDKFANLFACISCFSVPAPVEPEQNRAEQSNLSCQSVSQAHSSTLATTNIVPLFITVEWIAFGRINKINVQNNTRTERERQRQTDRVLNNPNEHWRAVCDQKILKSSFLQRLSESPFSHHRFH